MRKVFLLLSIVIFSLATQAQTIEGDGLIDMIGSTIDAPATIGFLNCYEIRHTAGTKFSSAKYGIDASVQNDSLLAMQIYRSNTIYGSYSNKLPKGIEFGMSPGEVIKKLGKPTTEYMNTGYSEYVFGNRVMTCWYEKGMLNQLSISVK